MPRAPSFPLFSAERVGNHKPDPASGEILWRALVRPGRKVAIGERLVFPRYGMLEKMRAVLDKDLKGGYQHVMFDNDGIKIYLKDGTYVLLGDGGDLEKKVLLIPVIVSKLKEQNEKYEGLNLATLEVPSYIKKEGVN